MVLSLYWWSIEVSLLRNRNKTADKTLLSSSRKKRTKNEHVNVDVGLFFQIFSPKQKRRPVLAGAAHGRTDFHSVLDTSSVSDGDGSWRIRILLLVGWLVGCLINSQCPPRPNKVVTLKWAYLTSREWWALIQFWDGPTHLHTWTGGLCRERQSSRCGPWMMSLHLQLPFLILSDHDASYPSAKLKKKIWQINFILIN